MNQRIILVLTTSINDDYHFYLRDITQIYTQSKISLNRQFFIRLSAELELSDDAILKIIKSLYDVSEIDAHCFNTYYNHHKKKLQMIKSTFDSCLLHTIN